MSLISEVVDNGEEVARFIFKKSDVRHDGSVKGDPFVPFPYIEHSVTRHITLSEDQIWSYGHLVARLRELGLLGRADVTVAAIRDAELDVLSTPQPDNPTHADIVGWSATKDEQKILALKIAQHANWKPLP